MRNWMLEMHIGVQLARLATQPTISPWSPMFANAIPAYFWIKLSAYPVALCLDASHAIRPDAPLAAQLSDSPLTTLQKLVSVISDFSLIRWVSVSLARSSDVLTVYLWLIAYNVILVIRTLVQENARIFVAMGCSIHWAVMMEIRLMAMAVHHSATYSQTTPAWVEPPQLLPYAPTLDQFSSQSAPSLKIPQKM